MRTKKLLDYFESEGLLKEDAKKKIQEKFKEYIKKDDLDSVKKLISFTGIKPTYETVQEGYKANVLDEALPGFIDIIKFTRVKPSEEVVKLIQDKFLKYLKMGGAAYSVTNVKHIIGSTGVKVSKETIQTAFDSLVGNIPLSTIEDIIKYSGIKPKENVVQEQYRRLLEQDEYTNFNKLKKMTGIKPAEDKVYGGLVALMTK